MNHHNYYKFKHILIERKETQFVISGPIKVSSYQYCQRNVVFSDKMHLVDDSLNHDARCDLRGIRNHCYYTILQYVDTLQILSRTIELLLGGGLGVLVCGQLNRLLKFTFRLITKIGILKNKSSATN